jgi:hypothetical protein
MVRRRGAGVAAGLFFGIFLPPALDLVQMNTRTDAQVLVARSELSPWAEALANSVGGNADVDSSAPRATGKCSGRHQRCQVHAAVASRVRCSWPVPGGRQLGHRRGPSPAVPACPPRSSRSCLAAVAGRPGTGVVPGPCVAEQRRRFLAIRVEAQNDFVGQGPLQARLASGPVAGHTIACNAPSETRSTTRPRWFRRSGRAGTAVPR